MPGGRREAVARPCQGRQRETPVAGADGANRVAIPLEPTHNACLTDFIDPALAKNWTRAPSGLYVHGPTGIEFCLIPGGRFRMGLSSADVARIRHLARRHEPEMGDMNFDACGPVHEVVVGSFLCAKFPARHWPAKGAIAPLVAAHHVEGLTHAEAAKWAKGFGWRLPSEAELEYAVRARTTSLFWWGDDAVADVRSGFPSEDWTEAEEAAGTNAFGLVAAVSAQQYCADTWHPSYQGAPVDGSAWLEESATDRSHVVRGGCGDFESWQMGAEWSWCASGYRYPVTPGEEWDFLTFRPVVSWPSA